jgi:riboflavin-specific deaminase-like protein
VASKSNRAVFVTLSYAQSLDGRIATAAGDSRWISGPATLELAQELRRDNRAIAVGIGTVLRDDPLLTCRLPGARNPLRVVFDSSLRIPLGSQLVASARAVQTLVFHAGDDEGISERRRTLVAAGLETAAIARLSGGLLDIRAAVAELGRRGADSLFVEGGARLITAFVMHGLVDRLVLVTAPIVIGRGIEAVGDLGVASLAQARRLRTVAHEFRGEDSVWTLEA